MEDELPKPDKPLYHKILRYVGIALCIGVGIMLVELFMAKVSGLL